MTPISYRQLTHVCIGAGTFFAAELLAQVFFPGAFPDQKVIAAIAIAFCGGLAVALLAPKWLPGETIIAAILFSLALSAEDIGAAIMSVAIRPVAFELFAFVCVSWFTVIFGLVGSSLGFAARLAIVGSEKKRMK